VLKLEPYQIKGAAWLASRKAAILADDPGLGKTPQSLRACSLINATRVVIVCPASLRYQWQYEIYKWYPEIGHQTTIVADGTQEIRSNMPIVSYNMVLNDYIRNQLIDLKPQVMIVDEAHYLKNMESQRTHCILGRVDNVPKSSLVHAAKHRWFLTATPLTGKPANLYPILTTIAHRKLHPYTTWPSFAKRYCGGFYDQFGHLQAYGAENCEELGDRLGSVMLRRRYKAAKGRSQPEPVVNEVHLKSTPAHRAYYKKLEEVFTSGEHKEAMLDHEMSDYKAPVVAEYVKHLSTKMDSLVVGYYHQVFKQTFEDYQAAYKKGFFKHMYVINGSTPMKDRPGIVKQFNKTGGLFLGQIDCCREGLNGLEAGGCNNIVFGEIPHTPDAIEQYIGRLRRGTQKKVVFAKLLVCEATIDSNRLKRIGRYTRNINGVMKGARVC